MALAFALEQQVEATLARTMLAARVLEAAAAQIDEREVREFAPAQRVQRGEAGGALHVRAPVQPQDEIAQEHDGGGGAERQEQARQRIHGVSRIASEKARASLSAPCCDAA